MTKRQTFQTPMGEIRDNYWIMPFDLQNVVSKHGEEIRSARDLGILSDYWREFADHSYYEAYLEGEFKEVLLTTKTGDKAVSAVFRNQKGAIVLLPSLVYDEDQFTELRGDEEYWTEEAIAFGKRLVKCLVEMDKALHSDNEVTPTPDWVFDERYQTTLERNLKKRIVKLTDEINQLLTDKNGLDLELQAAGKLKRLLYERGTALEEAILEALRLLGFQAEQYRDSDSEFDAVFVSSEGRFLGEAEGKDNGAINVDKLSQLERNLQEDFNREDVSDYANGVLFGNAFRLSPPNERAEFFTDKCLSGAKRSKVALVRTTDLFNAANYLKGHNDPDYAKACREAIHQGGGLIVTFPSTTASSDKVADASALVARTNDE